MSEIKKNPAIEEINEEELDLVAGGVYTKEQWDAMSMEERIAAQSRSAYARYMGKPCEMD